MLLPAKTSQFPSKKSIALKPPHLSGVFCDEGVWELSVNVGVIATVASLNALTSRVAALEAELAAMNSTNNTQEEEQDI
jgi:hypothetical protein